MARTTAIIVADTSARGFKVLAFTNCNSGYEIANMMDRAQRRHMGLVSHVTVSFTWTPYPTELINGGVPRKVRSNIKLVTK